jgi:hypothetical protein
MPASIPIYGFISTSRSKEAAIGFVKGDARNNKFAVLYEIQWKKDQPFSQCYSMDDTVSSFPDE